MEGKRTINSIKLKNILSFGSEGQEIELQPLNVLIGPNASGKSNFIEVFRLMSYFPRDINKPISDGGGINEWLWKGGERIPLAEIETVLPSPQNIFPLRHCIKFTAETLFLSISDETVKEDSLEQLEQEDSYFYRYVNRKAFLKSSRSTPPTIADSHSSPKFKAVEEALKNLETQFGTPGVKVTSNQSILQQRREPQLYPELYYLSELLPTFRFYDDFDVRRYSRIRQGQNPASAGDFLEQDASNLGVVFVNLPSKNKQEIATRLKDVNADAEEILAKIEGGIIRVSLQEQGLYSPTLPSRLSAGTLRYLCLLVILCHPTPPPLICIEEPESGLHPDVIHKVAELLIEASQRTQLIVTTHSSSLISALSNIPESVIVCEREISGTTLRRLEPERLAGWLERYELGELWEKGVIGGNRL